MRGSQPRTRPRTRKPMSSPQRAARQSKGTRSGASRARPELARLMREIRPGDVLVVVRLDRLARSVSHLLDVIERLEESGALSLAARPHRHIDAPGMFSLQVLGAVAQLERALISERTKAGIKAARARGKLPGNPGLRQGIPPPSPRPRRREIASSPAMSSRPWTDGCRRCDACGQRPLGGRCSRTESGRRGTLDNRALAARRSKSSPRAASRRETAGKDASSAARGSPDDDDRRHRHGKS